MSQEEIERLGQEEQGKRCRSRQDSRNGKPRCEWEVYKSTHTACRCMKPCKPLRHVCPSCSSSRTSVIIPTCSFVAAANCCIRAFVSERRASIMLERLRTRTGEKESCSLEGIGMARSCVSRVDSEVVRSSQQSAVTITLELPWRRRSNKRA